MLILTNISRSKDNQAMKSGQLIEYNIIIFLKKKPYTKYDEKTSSRLFFKKRKLIISLDQQFEFSYCLFSWYVQAEDYHYMLKLRCRLLPS